MLLHRFARSLREQNWTAILIEFVLLVLGVFLGIQVSNWNQDRQQAQRQADYLERLRVDFTGTRDRIREHFAIYGETAQGADGILSLLESRDRQPVSDAATLAGMSRAFNGLISTRIPPPLPATYVEMRSEGQLSHIRDLELRDKLAQYDGLLGVAQEVARITGDNLVQQGPILQRYFTTRSVIDDASLSGIRNEVTGFDLAGMHSDRDFAAAVRILQRGALNSRAVRQRQLALVEEILTLIDREQKR